MNNDNLLKTEVPNKAVNKIKEMQLKWGLSVTTKTFNKNDIVMQKDAGDMYSWLAEGKAKSGWNGSVPTTINPNKNDVVKNIFDTAYTTAEAIRTHCPCNCNYCSCNCNHCSCDCDNCCTDGNNSF